LNKVFVGLETREGTEERKKKKEKRGEGEWTEKKNGGREVHPSGKLYPASGLPCSSYKFLDGKQRS